LRVTRKHLLLLAGILCGALIGGSAAFELAEHAQLEQGIAGLDLYAERLLSTGKHFAQETDRAVQAVLDDRLDFCSDQEIAFMRDFVYNSANVKNIGRVQDGKLYCSANLGRLATPAPLPDPDISESADFIFINLPSMISGKSSGFVTVAGGVAVALNPELYKSLDEPPLIYSGLFHSVSDNRMLRGFGHGMLLTAAEIVAGRLIERDGVFYLPRCKPRGMFCVIAAEPRRDMLAGNFGLRLLFLVSGDGFGASLALVLALLYQRERSLRAESSPRGGQCARITAPSILSADVAEGIGRRLLP